MKRSRHIALTVLTSLSLAACGSDQATQQARYLTQKDCVEDWGSSDNCEPDNSGHWNGPHYYYYGGRPYYYPRNLTGGPMPVADSAGFSRVAEGSGSPRATVIRATSVSRGGFGSSAGLHGSSS